MARNSKKTPRTKKPKPAPTDTPRLHPNPQFARPGWVSLDGEWAFTTDPRGEWTTPESVRFTGRINVPFAPETPMSGVGDTGFFQACWYRRTFDMPALEEDRRVILRFGAVDHRATVWVNGRIVAIHEGGYTPFWCDITGVLTGDGEQTIVVRAEDDPHDLTKPRGKQDWQLEPHGIWYPRTSGIWQPVWLETVGRRWLETIDWTPSLERFEIDLRARLAPRAEAHTRETLRLRVRLTVGDRVLADDEYGVVGGEVNRSIGFSDPGIDDYRNELLWSPQRPTLIRADLELRDEDGTLLDTVNSYTALRSVGVVGERFMLNGRPRYLRLVLDQGYWPESGLTPPSDEAARRDVELTREMGFNGVRAHQRIADPRYLYWADHLGLLVWEEMPSPYRFTPETVRRITREWGEAIERDRSHPCVVAWVPINESWGVPDLPQNPAHRDLVRTMYHLTKSLDPTRPVIGNDGWEMAVTDIVAIHDYDASPGRIRERYANRADPRDMLRLERPGHRVLLLEEDAYQRQPIMLTEFGGIALRREGVWGYSQAATPKELGQQYRELLLAVHSLRVFSGFCYTQFADTYQEANGLLFADRTPKFDLKEMHAATTGRA